MTAAVLERKYTVDDFEGLDDAGYELVDGELQERNVSMISSATAGRFMRHLANHVEPLALGELFDSEAIYRIFGSQQTVRRADVSFIAAARVPRTITSAVAPDLVVEVVSPGDQAYAVRAKANLWLDAGVRLVWVAWPETKEVQVFRVDRNPHMLSVGDELSGEDVVPGFRVPIERLFPAAPLGS